jgi:site-specific recombinase XerD
MRQAGDTRHGRRMRGLIVVLWRAGVRIHEALTLAETDGNERRGSLLIRHGKGDRRREVGMDRWAWAVLADWTADRAVLPPGAVLRDRRANPRPRVVRHRSACGAASPGR